MAFDYDECLGVDKLPTQWCWGCGDGVVLKCIIRAIQKLGWDMDDVCLVPSIGCSGRMSSYVNCNTMHTTRGRVIVYTTDIKLANPNKHVIVISGDGDTLAIGGNHTIHGCRRNIDSTHIVINNFIYGLANSQTSSTTPKGFYTVTAQFGDVDPNFDAYELTKVARVSFVAGGNVIGVTKLGDLIYKALTHKGYSFIDVLSNCHINLDREDKIGETMAMLDWIRNRVIDKSKFETMDFEEGKDKFPTSVLHEDNTQPKYCHTCEEVRKAAKERRMVDLGTLE